MILDMSEFLKDDAVWADLKVLAVKHGLTLGIQDGKAVLEPPDGCASLACQYHGSGSNPGDCVMVTTRHVRWFCSPACITPGMEAHDERTRQQVRES